VQYKPLDTELEVYSQIEVRIKFDKPSQLVPVRPSLYSRTFEALFNNTILYYSNFDFSGPNYPEFSIGSQIGAEYLIITVEDYVDDVQRLAAWKKRKGLRTKIEVIPWGLEASEIQTLIRTAYEDWVPAPTYVLLFGDCNAIRTNYEQIHKGAFESQELDEQPWGGWSVEFFDQNQETGGIGSDLPYFLIDGGDPFPEMIYGRISVDSQFEAETVVNKILSYEKDPPLDQGFYRNILSTAFYEDRDHQGDEDAITKFVYAAENIRSHLIQEGYTVHQNYSAYIGGSRPIPSDFPAYAYPEFWLDASSQYNHLAERNITANFDAGRFLVYHINHGGSKNMVYPKPWCDLWGIPKDSRDIHEGWAQPFFNATSLPGLSNGNLLPLVINIDCNTGWFDGETDRSGSVSEYYKDPLASHPYQFEYPNFGPAEKDCFAENITRMDGGAIAVIAASRFSYTVPGVRMLKGIMQAFWPGIVDLGNEPIYEMGTALLLGKMYMARETPDDYWEHMRNVTMHTFHLFGDPETKLWTGEPLNLDVDYPSEIGSFGRQRFVVNVSESGAPIRNAKVCLQKGDDIHKVGYTNHLGQVVFNIQSVSYVGKMNITVTKHNYRPHIREILCVCGGATIGASPDKGSYTNPVNFITNGFFPSETVSVTVDGLTVAQILPGTSSEMGSIPPGFIGFVNVIATGSISGQVATTVFKRMDGLANDVFIYSQRDDSTWHLAGGVLTWDNPCISIYDQNDNELQPNELQQLETYSVNITVYNQGAGDSLYTEVSLSYARFGAGLSWKDAGVGYLEIPSGDWREVEIPFSPLMEGPYCLKVSLYDSGDINHRNDVGIENVQILQLSSPAQLNLFVGNPDDHILSIESDYMLLRVTQRNRLSNIWNSTVLDYVSERFEEGQNRSVRFWVDTEEYLLGDWRTFAVELYVDNKLEGGFFVNVTTPPPLIPIPDWILPFTLGSIAGLGTAVVIYAIVQVVLKKKR
jgi:hypothetical protein